MERPLSSPPASRPFAASAAAGESARAALAADLVAAGRGDEAAMERAYRRSSGKIYALLLAMLKDANAADEVLQDTYLAAWRGAASFAPERASPMTWLITIARNKAIDRLRADSPQQRQGSLDDLAVEPADPRPSALTRIEASEDRARLHWCLDQLEDRQRNAIRTAFFAGVTYADLAERAGVPLGTMKSLVRRGLLRLKACLET